MQEQHHQATPDERRQNLKLRDLFENAYAMIEPFFYKESGWCGHSLEYLAFRVLRENFPQLDSGEVRILVVAAHRVFKERQPGQAQHLATPKI